MKLSTLLRAGALTLMTASFSNAAPDDSRPYANAADLAQEQTFAQRAADWRNGAIVYQVIVDRFAPPENLEAKKALYPEPKKLRQWSENPTRGRYVESVAVWSHEIDFWGGDLKSLRTKLDYVHDLGVDVLYLNPIHKAYTNHKYDAQDYFGVSEEYGTRDDVKTLAENVHARGMKLMLDGVFNHMGKSSPLFQDAMKGGKHAGWFYPDKKYKLGYLAWVNVANLPELNLENPEVRARIYGDPDSVIQGYLRDGVDGWRLDVAFDIGFRYLQELTEAAHSARPGSLVIGEIWNYPEEWSPSVDGVMNMTTREIVLQLCKGNVSGSLAGRQIERLVSDYGIENQLKSWIIIDNHDTPRLKHSLSTPWQQHMAQALQFTLPGSPCVYYGVELGMDGGEDPENRGPMRWDLVKDDNADLQWMKKLIGLRKDSAALRYGDFRLLESDKLLAFIRRTDRVADMRIVLANPSEETVTEFLVLRDSKIMSYAKFTDELSDAEAQVMAGTLTVKIPPQTIQVLKPVMPDDGEYTPYKRVQ